MKLGWYLHACAYLCINLALMALAFSQGRHWAIYPALGWGLGLLIHGLVVWLVSASSPVWQRMVAREMQSLQNVTPPTSRSGTHSPTMQAMLFSAPPLANLAWSCCDMAL